MAEPANESLISVLIDALENDPGNTEVRRHLVKILTESQRHTEAWNHATVGLGHNPADIGLLRSAVELGDACNEQDRAAQYKKVLDALERVERDPVADIPDSPAHLVDMWRHSDAMPEPEVGELMRAELTFEDVGGLEEVKKRLNSSFLTPLRNPQMQEAFGKSLRGGLLLWGPPGCGKTFIARAVAGELGASFYSVGVSDVLDMWVGSSEKNIKSVFDVARENAPCVLFLDELDALGHKRLQLRGGSGAMRGVVNQLLQEMDGVGSRNEGVFVLAATNHPWDIDSALLRPGRLDRRLLVLPPDQLARESIFEFHLRGKPLDGLQLGKAAKSTEGLTGADIALVCDEAAEYAMNKSIQKGSVQPITMKDIHRAIRQVQPSYGPWADAARNFALFNNEGGEYDELLTWLKKNP